MTAHLGPFIRTTLVVLLATVLGRASEASGASGASEASGAAGAAVAGTPRLVLLDAARFDAPAAEVARLLDGLARVRADGDCLVVLRGIPASWAAAGDDALGGDLVDAIIVPPGTSRDRIEALSPKVLQATAREIRSVRVGTAPWIVVLDGRHGTGRGHAADLAAAMADGMSGGEDTADARILLITDGSPLAARRLLRTMAGAEGPMPDIVLLQSAVPEETAATLAAGMPPIRSWPRPRGGVATPLVLAPDAGPAPAIDLPLAAAPTPERLARVRERLAEAGLAPSPTTAPATAPPEPGDAASIRVRGDNRVLEIEITSVRRPAADADREPRPGFAFVSLDATTTNRVAPELRLRHGVEGVGIADLRRQVFLLVDDHWLAVVPAERERPAGHMPSRLELLHVGDAASGQLLFEVPRDRLDRARSLDLAYFPLGFAPVIVRVAGSPTATRAARGPGQIDDRPSDGVVAGTNTVASLRLGAVRERPDVGGVTPAPGARFLELELLGRSRFSRPTAAIRLDPAAPDPEARRPLPRVFDWKANARMIQLRLPDDWVITPRWELSEMRPELPLLPDRHAGGRLVFEVPDDVASATLLAEFAEFKLTTGESLGTPAAIRLPVLGGGAEPATDPDAIAFFDDDPIAVRVLSAGPAERDADGDGDGDGDERIVRVELHLSHESGRPPGESGLGGRLRLDVDGRSLAPESVVGPTGRPLAEPLWFGDGARRRATVRFAVPQDARAGRLQYAGITGAFSADLDLGGGTAGSAAPDQPGAVARAGDDSAPAGDIEAAETTAPAPAVDLVPRGLAGVGLTARQVNDAIDAGRDFLWTHVNADGGFTARSMRETLPAALALAHTDAADVYPEFRDTMRRFVLEYQPRSRTYQLAVLCLLIDALGDPELMPLLERYTLRLINGQGSDGVWDYSASRFPLGDEEDEDPLAVQAGHPPAGAGAGTPLERTLEDPAKVRGGDNSLAQFVVLAFRSAERRGFDVPDEAWAGVRERFIERQHEDGGWPYRTGASTYGSMTCAGISSLLLTGRGLGLEDPHDHEGIRRGLAWLDEAFTVSTNPRNSRHHLYYLYSLERTGRLLDTEFLGRHEWYPAGARFFVDTQRPDGSWVGAQEEKEPRLASAYALLFLTRATETLEPEPGTGGPGRLVTEVELPAPRPVYVVLDASGSMMADAGGGRRFDLAVAALRNLAELLPDTTAIGLRVYGHRRTALDENADEDSELVLPVGPLDREAFEAVLDGLRPRGRTPLAYSLEQSRRDLARLRQDARIIILTDGGEDPDSGRDPIAAVERIGGSHDVHVVGLAIDRPDWTRQLRAMAAAAGGRYWPVDDVRGLAPVLESVAFVAPGSFTIADADGRQVVAGAFGDEIALPPGRYRLTAEWGGVAIERRFWIRSDEATRVLLRPALIDPAARAAIPGPAASPTPAAGTAPAADQPATDDRTVKFCSECGAAVTRGARFCGSCGARLPGSR